MNEARRIEIGRRYASSFTSDKLKSRAYKYHVDEMARTADCQALRQTCALYMKELYSYLPEEKQTEYLALLVASNMEYDERAITHICDEVWGEV